MELNLTEMWDLQDAMFDELLDRHPRRTITLRISMDLAQGIWLEEYEDKEKYELSKFSESSFCPQEIADEFRKWLVTNWNQYLQSRKKERKPKPISSDPMKGDEWLRKFYDKHIGSKYQAFMTNTFFEDKLQENGD